ncbi:MAG: hypothetical protein ACM3ZT_08570 [Bacillota bacterium]
MQMPKDANERVKLWQALGQQPGVSAWFSVWQLARIGRPSPEVWGGAPRLDLGRRAAGNCR